MGQPPVIHGRLCLAGMETFQEVIRALTPPGGPTSLRQIDAEGCPELVSGIFIVMDRMRLWPTRY